MDRRRYGPKDLIDVFDSMALTALNSGVQAWFDERSFRRFGRDEWPYYDGIPDRDPMRILPDDVQVTVSMNSFVNTAAKVRDVHRGLSRRWGRMLPEVPVDADLSQYDPDLTIARDLLHAACTLRGVLLATATKVLHRKRPSYVPMIDSVVINSYCDATGRSALKNRSQEGEHAASVGVFVMRALRDDLNAHPEGLQRVMDSAAAVEAPMTQVRALEVAIWMGNEEAGYYR